ncbi:hypothetical protein [Thiocapsa sp.]|uniref:hypothetical protein n=1 Tax=Thiocapsa sp. TaxID=2024551 RepID=UPI0026313612|nr:hypothetical protein [Thiocapsa sp.]
MTKNDSPPCVITPGIVAEIAERLGRSAVAAESAGALRLRRVNGSGPFMGHWRSRATL